ncbi:hypothetical protein KR222_007276, partial [Zaprionus bogoriensis]
AEAGCSPLANPENGEIELKSDFVAAVICQENFVVAGNAHAYCNGIDWDRILGSCRPSNHSLSHVCDFETADKCGWSTGLDLVQRWQRVATVGRFHSHRTGPRHDHTLQDAYGGHYMLMESLSAAYGVHHLISPTYARALSLKTACCFRFHYFMYGSGVGSLIVSVKPHQLHIDEMWDTKRETYAKFKVSGNQGNMWIEHTIQIDEMDSDFQVVFTATDATASFGDIAIDDVRLMTGRECGEGAFTTTTEQPVQETGEPVVFDMMNCRSRCNESAPDEDLLRADGKLIKACGCDDLCLYNDNCCPDYIASC